MRKAVFESIHKVSHPVKQASWRLISRSFAWEFLSRDVNLWAQSCISCQWSKVQTQIKTPVHHIPVPGRRFSHIHVDLVGPQSSGFYNHLSFHKFAGGNSSPVHYGRRFCKTSPTIMDPFFWFPFRNNLRPSLLVLFCCPYASFWE